MKTTIKVKTVWLCDKCKCQISEGRRRPKNNCLSIWLNQFWDTSANTYRTTRFPRRIRKYYCSYCISQLQFAVKPWKIDFEYPSDSVCKEVEVKEDE